MRIDKEYFNSVKLYCDTCGHIKILNKRLYKSKGYEHTCKKDQIVEKTIEELKQDEAIEVDLSNLEVTPVRTEEQNGIKFDIVPIQPEKKRGRPKNLNK